jgi:hypothetical protein
LPFPIDGPEGQQQFLGERQFRTPLPISIAYGLDDPWPRDGSSDPLTGYGLVAGLGNAAKPENELYVISGSDASLDDLADRLGRQGSRVLRLDPSAGLRDCVQQLDAEVEPGSLSRLHLINHGAPDQLVIGSTVLSSRNLGHYRNLLERLGSRLTHDGDLLLWGCDIAESAAGQRMVSRLAELTGADVAASIDLTFADAASGRPLHEALATQAAPP